MENKTRVPRTRIASEEYLENQTLQMIAKTFQYKAEKGLADDRNIKIYEQKLMEERENGLVSNDEFDLHLEAMKDKYAYRNLSPTKRAKAYEQRNEVIENQINPEAPVVREEVSVSGTKENMVNNQQTITVAGYILPEYKYVTERIGKGKEIRADHIGSALTTLMEDVKGNKIGKKDAEHHLNTLYSLKTTPGTTEHAVLTTVSKSYQPIFEKKGIVLSLNNN